MPLECKQLENVLLLMKVSFVICLFIVQIHHASCNDIFISVKENLKHAWLLGPHALGKLTHNGIFISVKQNLRRALLLRPRALGKLTHYDIFISVK